MKNITEKRQIEPVWPIMAGGLFYFKKHSGILEKHLSSPNVLIGDPFKKLDSRFRGNDK